MPTFLSDPPSAVYLILAAAVLVSGLVWFNRRDRKSLLAFAAVLLVAGLVVLLDFLFESPREESVRRVKAMMKAADAHDSEAFVSHLADKLQYKGESGPAVTITREQIRRAGFWELLRQHNAHVAAWDFSRADVVESGPDSVEIGFLAKGEAQDKQFPMYFRATFTRQPDGQMKLTALASFDPVKRTNERKTIPYFPGGSK
jgi:hypothetical protein